MKRENEKGRKPNMSGSNKGFPGARMFKERENQFFCAVCRVFAKFLRIVSFLLVFGNRAAVGQDASYNVQGNLTYELQLQDGGTFTQEKLFEVNSIGCQWQITIINLKNHDVDVIRYDETNIVYYGPTNAHDTIAGMVENIPVPEDWAGTAGHCVWLAYASGCYFRQLTNSEAYSFNPVNTPTGFHGRYKEPCNFELLKNAPNVLAWAEYSKTGKHILTDEGKWDFQKYLPPFQNGFTEVKYSTQALTNVNNMTFPLSFEYRGFIPLTTNGQNDPKCVLVVRGTATSISLGTGVIGQIPHTLLVQDYRVPEPNAQYWNIGGVIPQTNAPAVTEARTKAAKSLAEKKLPLSPVSHPCAKSLIFILIILPPVMYLLAKAVKLSRRSKNHQ